MVSSQQDSTLKTESVVYQDILNKLRERGTFLLERLEASKVEFSYFSEQFQGFEEQIHSRRAVIASLEIDIKKVESNIGLVLAGAVINDNMTKEQRYIVAQNAGFEETKPNPNWFVGLLEKPDALPIRRHEGLLNGVGLISLLAFLAAAIIPVFLLDISLYVLFGTVFGALFAWIVLISTWIAPDPSRYSVSQNLPSFPPHALFKKVIPLHVMEQYKTAKKFKVFDYFVVASPCREDFKEYGLPKDPVLLGLIMETPGIKFFSSDGWAKVTDIKGTYFFEIGRWDMAKDLKNAGL